MSVTLKIDNFATTNVREKTYLTQAVAVSATSLPVKSTQNIVKDLYALIGFIADENTEIRLITAVDTTLTVSALSRAHNQYSDIIILSANQIKIYRASNVDGSVPADEDFSVLTTINIDTDQHQTTYVDTGGDSSYWYRFTYYNQQLETESSLSDSIAVRGGSQQIYASNEQIRAEAGFKDNPYITDSLIDENRLEAQATINDSLQGSYDVPFDTAPPIIQRITKILAAGYLLKKEYGQGAVGTTADGQAKIDEAMSLLEQITTGVMLLTDGSGSAIGNLERISGWPNRSTKTTKVSEGGSTRRFRMGQRF